MWVVDRALYGLQTSPSDWSVFRDGKMGSWTWSKGDRSFRLECTREPNLWRIKEKSVDGTDVTVGHILVYVDDMLVTGETEVIESYLDHVRGVWQCSPPEWLSRDGPAVKFCGFELKEGASGSIQVSQEAYAKELVKRYGCTKTRPVPISPTTASNIPEEKDPVLDPKLVRQAQAITGEVLWLALRTRPDLAFAVGVMGRHATKNPGFVCHLGREVVEYINGSTGLSLEYGRCDPTDRGPDDGLPFPRSMRRLEAYADISFAPQASRSIQGVLVLYGGSPIMWESSRQSCVALSTAESELLSYVEAMSMADSMGCILEALEEVPCQLTVVETDDEETSEELYIKEKVEIPEGEFIDGVTGIQRVIYGDNTAAISVASAPEGGAWRSRHLRLRSHFLRERQRLRHRQWWCIRHLPGSLLVADFLTKAISAKQRWDYFVKFLKLVYTAAAHLTEEVKEQETEVKALQLNHEIIKIAAASLGFMATKAMQPGQPGSYDEKTKNLVLLWLWVYLKKRVDGLKQQGLLPMNPEQWKQELEKPGSTLKALRISERALSHDADEKDFRSKLSSSEAVQLAHHLLLELPAEEREGGLSDRDLKDENYVEEEAMIQIRALRLHPDHGLPPDGELALPADDALWDDLGLCPDLCQPRSVPDESLLFPDGALRPEGALPFEGDLHDGGSLQFGISGDDRNGSSLHLGGDLRDGGSLQHGASMDNRGDSTLRPGGGLCDDGLPQPFEFSPRGRHGSSLLSEGALRPCGALIPESIDRRFDELGGGMVVNGSLEGSWKPEEGIGRQGTQPSTSSSSSLGLHPGEGLHGRFSPCTSFKGPAGSLNLGPKSCVCDFCVANLKPSGSNSNETPEEWKKKGIPIAIHSSERVREFSERVKNSSVPTEVQGSYGVSIDGGREKVNSPSVSQQMLKAAPLSSHCAQWFNVVAHLRRWLSKVV